MNTIDKINYYLVKQGKTGADLSRALGLSNSVYSQWNTGKTKPKKSKLIAIAEYLGVSVEDILPDGAVIPEDGTKKALTETSEREGISPAKQALLDAIDSLSDEQCEKLLIVVEGTKKLL